MSDTWPTDHADCASGLTAHLATYGTDATVSERRPIIPNSWSTDPYTCPHRVTFWVTPVADTDR